MNLKLSRFIHVVLKLFHFSAHVLAPIFRVCGGKKNYINKQTDRHLAEEVCSVTCKAKYRDLMLYSEAVQFISLFLLRHMVSSHAVVIPPVTFPQPKETPYHQNSFPPHVIFSHMAHYHGTVFLQYIFLILEKKPWHCSDS